MGQQCHRTHDDDWTHGPISNYVFDIAERGCYTVMREGSTGVRLRKAIKMVPGVY